jgi:hypothetical protein
MRRSRTISLGLALVAIAVGLAIIALGRSGHRFHARSRLKLEVKETHFFPIFDRDEYEFMNGFLKRPESRLALATATGIEEKEFAVEKVGPVRCTPFFYINCSGPDSNNVQCVASNAANAIVVFYATNQPSWKVTYIDTSLFTPTTLGERLKRLVGL